MNILGLIPARGGSKGVPFKNKKLLNGKPLITYSIQTALDSKHVSKVVVSSDDQEIIDIALSYGAEAPFVRPKNLATDTSTSLSVVQHCLEFYKDKNNFFDAVCLLQPTVPFRSLDVLERAIEKFMTSDFDSLVSVLKVPHQFNPHWVFKSDKEGCLSISTGDKEIISRRQDLPNSFYRDGSIYLIKTDVIFNNSLFGRKVGFIESDTKNFVNIDTLDDWKKAEDIAAKIDD